MGGESGMDYMIKNVVSELTQKHAAAFLAG